MSRFFVDHASCNIDKAIQMMFSLLTGRELLFKEKIDWLQFTYTVGCTGAYVVPVFTVLAQSAVLERYPLFTEIWRHLLHI